MSKLGDLLAEYFQSKARLIRAIHGLRAMVVWFIIWLIFLTQRIVIWVFILKATNAPTYIWGFFWGVLPVAILLEQFEIKEEKGE